MHLHDHAHHHHGHDETPPRRWRLAGRVCAAVLVLAAAGAAACAVAVPAGEAVVVTRLGDPVRVLTAPGLAWKLPAPLETTIPVDLRVRTTSGGFQDVGTRDGLRVLVQAYVAWQVTPDDAAIRRYLRSLGNSPEETALQLRSFLAAALHVAASGFDLSDLVNTDPARVRIGDFEQRLKDALGPRLAETYGLSVHLVGIERLSLPSETLAATVSRMRAERETVAAERTADGLRQAGAIRADAQRDARITIAGARAEVAAIEGRAEREAATIHADAFAANPHLYLLLRSLDMIGAMVGSNTRLILRTDAAPFRALVDGPGDDDSTGVAALASRPADNGAAATGAGR